MYKMLLFPSYGLFIFVAKTKQNKTKPKHTNKQKVSLKLNIQKMKFMASSPITSWEIDGERVETVSDFILGAAKSLQMVIATMKLKDDYSLEEKL